MAAPSSAPRGPRGPQESTITQAKSPVAAHPITSAAIGLLIMAAICGTLFVPIYARITPKIGDLPFFYFYLIAYMPVAAIVLGVVNLLSAQAATPAGARAAPWTEPRDEQRQRHDVHDRRRPVPARHAHRLRARRTGAERTT